MKELIDYKNGKADISIVDDDYAINVTILNFNRSHNHIDSQAHIQIPRSEFKKMLNELKFIADEKTDAEIGLENWNNLGKEKK